MEPRYFENVIIDALPLIYKWRGWPHRFLPSGLQRNSYQQLNVITVCKTSLLRMLCCWDNYCSAYPDELSSRDGSVMCIFSDRYLCSRPRSNTKDDVKFHTVKVHFTYMYIVTLGMKQAQNPSTRLTINSFWQQPAKLRTWWTAFFQVDSWNASTCPASWKWRFTWCLQPGTTNYTTDVRGLDFSYRDWIFHWKWK